MKHTLSILIIILTIFLCGCQVKSAGDSTHAGGLVILAGAGEKYNALAQEIADSEHAPLKSSWGDALANSPDVVLWVVSPEDLSDEAIIAAGHALKDQSMLPAVGLISGKTIESARSLWQRGQQIRADWETEPPDVFIAANGVHPTAGTSDPRLTVFKTGEPPEVRRMDLDALKGAFQQADYLTFTGHGGDSYLRIDPQAKLETGNLSEQTSPVIESTSCQTMRPWSGDSIALDFTEHGTAVYAGFAYSPLAGYMIGELRDMPSRYSWPEFTVGDIAALQNRAALQGFADFPFFFLLGDPRIALTSEAPYEAADYEGSENTRTYTFRSAPAGMIPVRIPDGGDFRYVDVTGVADTADGDPFFNSRLQAASRNGDKFILFNHKGGDFTIELRKNPPFYWWPARLLTASFDDVTLFSPLNGGNWIMVVCGLISTGSVFLRRLHLKRKNRAVPGFMKPILAGLGFTLMLGVYQILRLPVTTINTKAMAFDPIWLAGVFLLLVSGLYQYAMAQKWPAKALALLTGTLPALLPGLISLMIVGVTNLLIMQRIGSPVYNLHTAAQPLIAGAIWLPVFWSVCQGSRKTRTDENKIG